MKHAILATALAALSTLTADAALITWGAAQNIAGDTDVSTAGTLIGAINLGSTTTTTVNTVAFTGTSIGAGGVNSGVFQLTGGLTASDWVTSALPFGGLSAGYQQLVRTSVFSGGPTWMTLTLSGLSLGAQYQFQFWTSDSAFIDTLSLTTATAGNAVTLNPAITVGTGFDGSGGLGQFALGTFTADAATQQIVFTGAPFAAAVNGMQLRQLAPAPAAVPEPGTVLAGVMVVGLLGLRRRRG